MCTNHQTSAHHDDVRVKKKTKLVFTYKMYQSLREKNGKIVDQDQKLEIAKATIHTCFGVVKRVFIQP